METKKQEKKKKKNPLKDVLKKMRRIGGMCGASESRVNGAYL